MSNRSSRLAWLGLIALSLALPVLAQDRLANALAAIDGDPELSRAIWGIRIEEEHDTVLVARESSRLLMPGSVRKLFTAVAIGSCEGWDATIPTEVRITGDVRRHALRGDLVVVAHGDPSLGGRWEYDTDRFVRFRPVIEALRARGVRRIDGAIVIDVSEFDDALIPSGWKWDNLTTAYAAPVDAIAFNENAAGVRIRARGCAAAEFEADPPFARVVSKLECGGDALSVRGEAPDRILIEGDATSAIPSSNELVAVPSPAAWAGEAIRSFLGSNGISAPRVEVVRRRRPSPEGSELIATIESPPVGAMSGTMIKESANLYAEMLLKRLSRGGGPASFARSLDIERELLAAKVGIDAGEFRFVDGSGLSSEDLVTPKAIVRLMRYMTRSSSRETYERMLAQPGGEGTLRRRLLDLQGRLYAKSGTINGVNALAGWVYRPDGKLRYFAILVNHHTIESREVNRAIDELVRAIAE